MANNRMYLVNRRTGVKIALARYYPSTGWYTRDPENLGRALNEGFDKSDWCHLTPEQRHKHELDNLHLSTNQGPPPEPPFYSANYPKDLLLWGDEWELEYEIDTYPRLPDMAQSEEQ